MATIIGGKFPIITLNNGLTVTNYGSNHEYTFDTDEVLGKCSDEVCRDTQLISAHNGMAQVMIDNAGTRYTIPISADKLDYWEDEIYKLHPHPEYEDRKMWLDVFINYQVSDRIQDDLLMIAEMDIIDIILVPYPLMDAWSYETRIQKEIAKKMTNGVEQFYNNWEFALLKMRTCKIKDRVTKVIHSSRFCGTNESSLVDRKIRPAIIDAKKAEAVLNE